MLNEPPLDPPLPRRGIIVQCGLFALSSCYTTAMKFQLQRYLGSLVFIFLLCLAVAVGATAGVLFVYNSDLPQVSSLEDYHPSLITEVYSDDGRVIGSFALERRVVVTWEQIPQVVKDAI